MKFMSNQFLMNLTNDQIQQIEEFAAALMTAKEIAMLLGLNPDDRNSFEEICKNHESSDIFLAFQKGRLQTKFELRKTVIKLAKHGSPAAEPIADKYLREQLM